MYLSGIVVTLNDVAGLYAFDAEFAIPIIRWRWRWRCINSCVLNCNGYLPINIKGCGRIHFQKQPATQLADGVLLSSNNPSTLGRKTCTVRG
ncbi:unnamed protein product, partial [Vitis vinifera]|uniref:Uncharacterized protein n=1 Tax=Vitis vinifera TaxID=29760 RepID=D7SJ56_VITVI